MNDRPLRPDAVPRSRVWQQPDFRKLWFADLISQLGTQITFLGLPLIAVATLGASAFEVSLLQTIEWLPVLLISLPSGAWVDRLQRLPVLIVSDLLRAVALLLLPLAFLADALSIWLLYVVAFVTGALAIVFEMWRTDRTSPHCSIGISLLRVTVRLKSVAQQSEWQALVLQAA